MAVKRSSSGGSHASSSNKTSSSRSSGRSSSRPMSHSRRTLGTTTNRSTSRRGGGLNLGGPVGNANGAYRDRPTSGVRYSEEDRGGGGVSVWIIVLIVLIVFVAAGGGGALTDVFEEVFHSVKEQTEDIDTDAPSERFGDAIREGVEDLGLTGESGRPTNSHNRSASIASRSKVTQFSGVLSRDSDETVEPIQEDYVATEQHVRASALIDPEKFYWSTNDEGLHVLKLSDEDWEQIEEVKLNVFLDDGEGYIDLGLDSYFEFDDNLDLIGEYDYTWMCFDDYPVAFYHLTTIEKGDDWRMIGYVPVFLNDEHANIIVAFDNDNPEGYIAGAKLIEDGPGTDLSVEEMVSDLIEVKKGDTLDFICDYYDYEGEFINNYFFGERMTIGEDIPEIWYYEIPGDLTACYLLIDSDGNHYWTPIMD